MSKVADAMLLAVLGVALLCVLVMAAMLVVLLCWMLGWVELPA